jgi:glycosyltransferase involved in cell wall biosynthesis
VVVGAEGAGALAGRRLTRTSVLVPTFRRPALLQRAVRSALGQSHRDLEVWVYDNASGDETAEVVARLAAEDPRVHYHAHATNLGSFANFRHAIEHVRTPFFSVLADDDMLLPDFHRLALETFVASPELAMVGLDCLHSELGGALLRRASIRPGSYAPPEGMLEMLRQGHPSWSSVLFRREVVDLIGGIDPGADLYLDLDVVLRTAARAPFVVRPEAGAVFFYHEWASGSSTSADAGRWPAFAHIIERTAADPTLPPSLREEAVRRLRAMFRDLLIKNGVGAARRGNAIGAASAERELRVRLGDLPASTAVRLAALAARAPGGRPLLERIARGRRPYTGERLVDRVPGDTGLSR